MFIYFVKTKVFCPELTTIPNQFVSQCTIEQHLAQSYLIYYQMHLNILWSKLSIHCHRCHTCIHTYLQIQALHLLIKFHQSFLCEPLLISYTQILTLQICVFDSDFTPQCNMTFILVSVCMMLAAAQTTPGHFVALPLVGLNNRVSCEAVGHVTQLSIQ